MQKNRCPVRRYSIFRQRGNRLIRFAPFVALALLFDSGPALACTNPAGTVGQVIYNTDEGVLQGCTPDGWKAFHAPNSEPCGTSPTPGDVCADGSVYAGLSPDGNVRIYTTPADAAGTYTWNDGTYGTYTTGAADTDSGEDNTNLLASAGDSYAPYEAALACYNLVAHGHTDWYLPAENELGVIYTNKAAIGGFYTVDDGSGYWSSTEDAPYDVALSRVFADGYPDASSAAKEFARFVRCVRREDSGCTVPDGTPGQVTYNIEHGTFQTCTADGWVAMHDAPTNLNPVTSGMIGYWKLDEASGSTAVDSSVNGNDGTLGGDPQSGSGPVGRSLTFDGTGDWVNLQDLPLWNLTGTDSTISLWMKSDTTHQDSEILDRRTTDGGYSISFGEPGYRLFGYFWTDTADDLILGPYAVTPEQWYHVVMVTTLAPQEGRLYINGSLALTDTYTGNLRDRLERLSIGGNENGSEEFIGSIDDVRIYNRALTEPEIESLYAYGASCQNPESFQGRIIYNSSHGVFQGCTPDGWKAFHETVPPCGPSPSPGDTCIDGTIYAGTSPDGGVPMYMTPADAGTFSWNNGVDTAIDTPMTDCVSYPPGAEATCQTGEANTALLVGLSNAVSPYAAALYCYCLGKDTTGVCASDPTSGANGYGYSDWYLPAMDELDVLWENLVDQNGDNTPGGPLGSTFGFDTSGAWTSGWYWSSSEGTASNGRVQVFTDGNLDATSKIYTLSVRCVRK